MTTIAALKRTPLHDIHVALGGKIVPFAGYEMPVQYPSGITAEHKAVRERAGLFDVSHMGEFIVKGPGAVDFVNSVTTNNAAALEVGQVQYSALLNARGTFVDDCLVYRFADHVMMVVNASNAVKDWAHILPNASNFDVAMTDASDETALLALQGPMAQQVLQPFTDIDLEPIGYYHFATGSVAGVPGVTVSRTGYTGEDGFELYAASESAEALWHALLAAGASEGLVPAGLAARDTLRLEAKMALYGNDIDDTTTVLEADLGWIVKLEKGEFLGRDALVQQKAEGLTRKLVGFETEGRAVARHGYEAQHGGRAVGTVTSGSFAPFLKKNIGLAYLPLALEAPGTRFDVVIRGRPEAAVVVPTPFYKRPR
jgi:aminomethyltransferase